jgi:AbrB family looped-hinge helix DNA binding protein
MTKQKSEKSPEFTTISSKGQIVIPISMRNELELKEGDIFAANIIENDIIVLKKVSSSLTDEDLKSIKRVNLAWKEIENNKKTHLSKEKFLEELKKW